MTGTPELTGAGGTTSGALISVSSDIAVSVSFQVASELLEAARETNTREEELIGLVFGVAVVLTALKNLLQFAKVQQIRSARAGLEKRIQSIAETFDTSVDDDCSAKQINHSATMILWYNVNDENNDDENVANKAREQAKANAKAKEAYVKRIIDKERARIASERTLLDFALLFTAMAARIAFSISVQLLAASARARQTSRGARVISLLALSVFFIFVESSAEGRIL